jgi:hypothetical protein
VIAIFQEASDIDLSYKAVSLLQTAPKKLQLTMKKNGAKNSVLRCRPFLLLIVDKKHLGDLKLKGKEVRLWKTHFKSVTFVIIYRYFEG